MKCQDGLPTDPSGKESVPVPLSFHASREKLDAGKGRKLSKWRNYLKVPSGDDEKQRRLGYLPADTRSDGQADLISPATVERGKTAIDPSKRDQASKSQLFAYQALVEGQSFITSIEAEDESTLQKATDILLKTGHRLGRSKTAEFGLVSFEEIALNTNPLLEESSPAPQQVSLLLISDLRIMREGNPTYTPRPEDFGVDSESTSIDWDRTFLRTRSYSPWNAYIDGYEDERHLITKGSVISLKLASEEDLNKIREKLKDGIGLNREEGFGRIALNPTILEAGSFFIDESPSAKGANSQVAAPCNHSLYRFALRKAEDARLQLEAEKYARRWSKKLCKFVKNLERETQKTFSPSQWQSLRGLAVKTQFEPDAFKKDLREYAENSLRSHLWSKTKVPAEGHRGRISLLNFILDETCGEDPMLRPRVAHLAANLASRKLREARN